MKRNKATLRVLVTAGIVLLAGIAILWNRGEAAIELTLPRQELQKHLESAFPVEKRERLYHLSVRKPRLLLREGQDRLGLALEVEVDLLGSRAAAGTLTGDAGLDYAPDSGAFFLKDPVIRSVEVKGAPRWLKDSLATVRTAALQAGLRDKPVAYLDEAGWLRWLLRRTLREVRVRNGEVVVALGAGR